MPDYGEIVLVLIDDGRVHTAMRKEGGLHVFEWQIMFSPYDDDVWDENEHGTITHWMSLDALPEPEY